MIYYGIINKIDEKHEHGIYGRRPLKKGEKIQALDDNIIQRIGSGFSILSPLLYYPYKYISKNKICVQKKDNNKNSGLIIPVALLNNDFDISGQKELFYGLFDEFKLPSLVFEKLLRSKGGSEFIILEKDKINSKHYGGDQAKFSNGIYIKHPKDNNVLIPLGNANELIKSFILEETIQAYEALGAKRILIEDRTNIHSNVSGSKNKVKASIDVKHNKEILREKRFGKGTFDIKRALENKLFIYDFPHIKSTLEARINGNQTKEIFTETVNLNAGLDLEVLDLFSSGVSFNYSRKWYFEVEFYDKNE